MSEEKDKQKILDDMRKLPGEDARFGEFVKGGESIRLYPPSHCESYDKTDEYLLLTDRIGELIDEANDLGVPLMVVGFPRSEKDVGQSIALSMAIENPKHNSSKFSEILDLLKVIKKPSEKEDSDFGSLLRMLKR